MCRSPSLTSPFALTAALAYIIRLRTKTISEGAREDIEMIDFSGLLIRLRFLIVFGLKVWFERDESWLISDKGKPELLVFVVSNQWAEIPDN